MIVLPTNLESWSLEEDARMTNHRVSVAVVAVVAAMFVAAGPRCHLFYEGDGKPFKNFHLKAEVMTEPGSNGGIYFHTRYQEKGWPSAGFSVPIPSTSGETASHDLVLCLPQDRSGSTLCANARENGGTRQAAKAAERFRLGLRVTNIKHCSRSPVTTTCGAWGGFILATNPPRRPAAVGAVEPIWEAPRLVERKPDTQWCE